MAVKDKNLPSKVIFYLDECIADMHNRCMDLTALATAVTGTSGEPNIYGRVYFYHGDGHILMYISCPTKEAYGQALEEGSRWVEGESGAVSIRGVPLGSTVQKVVDIDRAEAWL